MPEIHFTNEIQKNIQAALDRQPVLFAYLFGSTATHTRHRESDVDVAVYFDPTLSRSERFDRQLQLITSLAKAFAVPEDAVDITRLNDAPHLLQLVVLQEGVVLYERDRGRRLDFELRVLQEEDDQQSFRRTYNREFLHRLMTRSA